MRESRGLGLRYLCVSVGAGQDKTSICGEQSSASAMWVLRRVDTIATLFKIHGHVEQHEAQAATISNT